MLSIFGDSCTIRYNCVSQDLYKLVLQCFLNEDDVVTKSTELKHPLFIVGTGRCGSTVLHWMLAEHPSFAFLSRVLSRYPSKLRWQRLAMHAWDSPVTPRRVRTLVGPSEVWPFWEYCYPGFSTPYRDLRTDDVSQKAKYTLNHVFSELTTRRRSRLLVKLTGWTRVGFIKEAFPDAKIIHIIRDPHPVVNSTLNVQWWHGWHGPSQWRWGPLTPEEEGVWKRHGESFLVLAAIEWTKIMRAYRESIDRLPSSQKGDVMEVRYVDLCHDTKAVMSRILAFAGLPEAARFDRTLSRYNLASQDRKWQQNFTDAQQEELNTALEELGWQRLAKG